MKNVRITNKERNLLKGAIRRVFSRSTLRNLVLEAAIVNHSDPKHPRVTKWVKCANCKNTFPKYKAKVDHISPVVPVDKNLEDMSWDDLINNIWCHINNLQVLDDSCHDEKTSVERKLRKKAKDERQ